MLIEREIVWLVATNCYLMALGSPPGLTERGPSLIGRSPPCHRLLLAHSNLSFPVRAAAAPATAAAPAQAQAQAVAAGLDSDVLAPPILHLMAALCQKKYNQWGGCGNIS